MARAFQTTSPDVSREQARYRRLMQISSARSFDMTREGPRDSLASLTEANLSLVDDGGGDTNGLLRRPTTQQWPRKLEPLQRGSSCSGKDSGLSRLSPPSVHVTSARNTLSPEMGVNSTSQGKHKKTRRLHSVQSEDENEEAEEFKEPSRSRTHLSPDVPPLLPANENDSNNNSNSQTKHSPWTPICLETAQVAAQVASLNPAALSSVANKLQPTEPVSPPSATMGGSDTATATAAAFASTIATATISAVRPNAGRPKRLSPMKLDETPFQNDAG